MGEWVYISKSTFAFKQTLEIERGLFSGSNFNDRIIIKGREHILYDMEAQRYTKEKMKG